jgi:hypothetical protein
MPFLYMGQTDQQQVEVNSAVYDAKKAIGHFEQTQRLSPDQMNSEHLQTGITNIKKGEVVN